MKSVTTRISDFDDIDEIEHEALLTGSPERSWIWFGLIVSLCLHVTLCIYFYRTRFQSVDAVFSDVQQPMTFRVKPVDMSQIDKASGDQINPAAKPNPDDTKEQQPDEKKSFDKLLQEIQATTQMPDDMSKLPGDSAGPRKGTPGPIDLDQALSQKGPLGSGTQIGMPTDQLFGFDSADFQPSASGELEKLVTLMKRLPKATFTIEGYTDS